MSYGGYQQYGGNPYGGTGQAGYGQSNPYASEGGYGQDVEANPYGSSAQQPSAGYGQSGAYNNTAPRMETPGHTYPGPGPTATAGGASDGQPQTGAIPMQQSTNMPIQASAPMSNQDFLARVDGVKSEIRQLTTNIGEIGSIHQRIINSPDNSSSAQLNNLVSQTQVLNTRIKDQIKQLETDAAKSNRNQTKDSQIRTLKSNFKSQLEDYQREENTYRQRYREQIARQYKIVNPEASDMEVREAADADWGDEGVFQTALKSNRTGAATSVLGSVRARHNDIQQIERTLMELNQLFQDLAEQVILQEAPIQQTEVQTTKVEEDTRQGNQQLDKGIASARRARKLKWICFCIVVAIILILALILGIYFGLNPPGKNNGMR